MNIYRFRNIILFGIMAAVLIAVPAKCWSTPAFARQTNLPCSSCHTVFPELNSFGRFFKLNGYTLVGKIQDNDTAKESRCKPGSYPPISLMIQSAFTHTMKDQPGTQNNNISLPQQLSIFYSGKIAKHMGAFIQITYDNKEGIIGVDNIDLRYANQTELGSENLLYGVTLNNNPTVQDIWNSTPAWGYPYASTSNTVSPIASTLIEGGLAQKVAGLGAYALLNNLLYAELSVYRSAQQGGDHPPNNTSFGIIKSLAPYWRLALQKQFNSQYVELGTFGISTEIYPAGVTGLTDKYTDIGLDLNYEKSFGENQFTAQTSFIHEKKNLDATFNSSESLNQSLILNSFKVTGNFYMDHHVGFSLSYFSITGDGDAVLYAPAEFSGSSTGLPDSRGLILGFSYLPWLNTKFSIQYVAFNKFNGSGQNYDGAGRNASDNNSFNVITWIAF